MTPPKTPRATTAIPRDRDVRIEKTPTPTPGSIAAIGPNTERSLKIQQWDADASTPIGASDFDTMAFRAQRAAENSRVAVLEVEKAREEHREDLERVHDRIDVMGEHLGNVREQLGEVNGTLRALVPLMQAHTGAALQTQTVTMTAKVEVDKAQKLDVIEHKKWTREMWMKAIGLLASGGLVATLITMLAGKC